MDIAETVDRAMPDVEEVDAEIVEGLTVVTARACHTELYLYSDDTIALQIHNGDDGLIVAYWIDQARALHEALGHLLWLADHPATRPADDEE
jgi:hypothetical protein